MLPRVIQNQRGNEQAEQMSWRRTLKLFDFEMSQDEVNQMAAAAAAILHVRWQWIFAWLQTERAKLPVKGA